MIFEAARRALYGMLTPDFRSVLYKTLGLTALALVGLWFILQRIFAWLALPFLDQALPAGAAWAGWIDAFATIFAGLAIAFGLALLIAPVTALIAGLFLDDVAERVETGDYPADRPGRALPLGRSIVLSLKFFGVVILGNGLALLLLLVPGVNLIAFFVVNGYLLGREFFEFAAMRFHPEEEARALRRKHAGTVFVGGLVIAAFLAIPLVNLMTPLFAAMMMVHLHKLATGAQIADAAGLA